MSTLLSNHKQIEDFFPLKSMVFNERRSSIILLQTLDSKAFIANDMDTSIHRYSTIEFKSKK